VLGVDGTRLGGEIGERPEDHDQSGLGDAARPAVSRTTALPELTFRRRQEAFGRAASISPPP
jgi:hypothetical protein